MEAAFFLFDAKREVINNRFKEELAMWKSIGSTCSIVNPETSLTIS
jgi:hypothetical protein